MSKQLSLMEQFQKNSYLDGNSASYLEALYETFLQNPQALELEWREYFSSLQNTEMSPDISHQTIREDLKKISAKNLQGTFQLETSTAKQVAVDELIEAYRRFGHLAANINPLEPPTVIDPRLHLNHYGLSEADFSEVFVTKGLLDKPQATLQEIYQRLREVYCGTIGVEYTTISDERERHWLRDYVEHRLPDIQYSSAVKKNILNQLIAAETLEKYLDVKYVGQVRFSIEGGDSLIPLLDELTQRAREVQVEEIVLGMAHRGRLNVLLNIMGQSPTELFQEFEGTKEYGMTSGDVKYHKGYSRDVMTPSGPIHLSLAFNPSHLEFICPVVEGSVRARQERRGNSHKDYAMAVLVHGDASFAGQGVVLETLNMSQTRAYNIGGTLHIILNNQVGFTTSDIRDARSSHYCTDVAKILDAPVFHVNGDDPEAVVAVAQLALDYRMLFHKDIFIDLVCYRRQGHNEADEPQATQPLMYQLIRKHPTPRAIYAEKLIQEGVCTSEEVEQWIQQYRDHLDQGRQVVETLATGLSQQYRANWTQFVEQEWSTMVDTSVPLKKLKSLGEKITSIPPDFELQRQVAAIIQARAAMCAGKQPLDWGCAEVLAYASLADEGHSVRLVGEDVRRGTFFHRQSTWFDQKTGKEYCSLQHISKQQAPVRIYDSLLSEVGALGFEYGYSSSEPNALVAWEAQFGDFVNAAQVIIDQFISSGWAKWNRLSGLILLLPHGYEGRGPEHSSARIERFLQLCAEDNIQVCIPSTPAQIFHLLRRQVLRPYRAPLIIMTPKSFLRNKLAVSNLEDLSHQQFQLIIPEIDELDTKKVTRVVLCSGKVYYDLLIQRREEKLTHVAIVRVEQLYPFPYDELKAILSKYINAKEVVWCQEEPLNQGAWFCTRDRLSFCLQAKQTLSCASRPASAAPAAGYYKLHHKQQKELVDRALLGSSEPAVSVKKAEKLTVRKTRGG